MGRKMSRRWRNGGACKDGALRGVVHSIVGGCFGRMIVVDERRSRSDRSGEQPRFDMLSTRVLRPGQLSLVSGYSLASRLESSPHSSPSFLCSYSTYPEDLPVVTGTNINVIFSLFLFFTAWSTTFRTWSSPPPPSTDAVNLTSWGQCSTISCNFLRKLSRIAQLRSSAP